jgi:hypothetical protein
MFTSAGLQTCCTAPITLSWFYSQGGRSFYNQGLSYYSPYPHCGQANHEGAGMPPGPRLGNLVHVSQSACIKGRFLQDNFKLVPLPRCCTCEGWPASSYTLLHRRSSVAVLDYHQMRFLNRCRWPAVDNTGLSTVVLEPLLISIISNGFRTRTTVDTPSENRVSGSLLF